MESDERGENFSYVREQKNIERQRRRQRHEM